ncbi:MAG: hypothetical protein H7Y16_02055 [Candidatus Parcubacteria bacterium]|nr:hypothetical protein [Burkholderiales bacterium]
MLALLFALFFAALAAPAAAQDKDAGKEANETPAQAALDKFIVEMFAAHQGKSLCMLGTVPVPVVRSIVIEQLKSAGISGTASQQQVETALWTRFPCPFSPYRAELLPATAKDVEGVWLFPYESQPYRFGPSSPRQPSDPAKAIACEVVGYYPKGELRTGMVLGAKSACPFHKAADLSPARKRPQTVSWSLPAEGRMKVARSDGAEHVEEWDVFAVTRSFQALNMEIKAGDLIAYLRRDRDNDVNATIEFRHLQRLK